MDRTPRHARHGAATRRAAGALAVALLAGCSATSGGASAGEDRALRIDPGSYDDAFDAAVEVVRSEGMPAVLRDRRSGVIETAPRVAPSLFEPWNADGTTFDRRLAQTLAMQRRRVRFEFARAEPGPDDGSGARLPGPDLLGVTQARPDLTAADAPLELRVRVDLERAHDPGYRQSTWTRRSTTRMSVRASNWGRDPEPGRFWTPVMRDEAFEQRLLAAVGKQLTARTGAEASPESP